MSFLPGLHVIEVVGSIHLYDSTAPCEMSKVLTKCFPDFIYAKMLKLHIKLYIVLSLCSVTRTKDINEIQRFVMVNL